MASDALSPTTIQTSTRFQGDVLIVEDSETNRHVGLGLLTSLGIDPEIAVDGEDALEKMHKKRYDLVLMDIQMPKMDGLEATRKIRHLEQRQKRTPMPIIAMTANALPRDRRDCSEAGMDDHLPKPVRLENLRAVLERWLPVDTSVIHVAEKSPMVIVQDQTSRPPTEHGNHTIPVYDPAKLLDQRSIKELRKVMEVIEGGFDNVVKTFLEEVPTLLDRLESCGPLGDHEHFRLTAHTLKSNSGSLGVIQLAKCGQHLEQRGKDGTSDAPEVQEELAVARRIFEACAPQLHALLNRQ